MKTSAKGGPPLCRKTWTSFAGETKKRFRDKILDACAHLSWKAGVTDIHCEIRSRAANKRDEITLNDVDVPPYVCITVRKSAP